MAAPVGIDVRHLGNPGVICCYRQDDVIVDPGPASSVPNLLEGLDGFVPRAILLTHVHLDHASASGVLMDLWPEAELWVHEIGAPHMIDPERLIASATRLYGEKMAELWGEIRPVDASRVRALEGGELVGNWEVAYTPGHARHHVSYLHRPSMAAFTGDVAGMRIGEGPVLPPTPPPDIDLPAWRDSLDAIEAWGPSTLALTHFGSFDDVDGHLGALRDNLEMVGRWGNELDVDGFSAEMDGWLRSESGDAAADAYAQVMPADSCYAGLERAPAERQRLMAVGSLFAMSKTVELPRTAGPGSGLGGSWRVIVRNDDHNTFDHVASTLARCIPGVTLDGGYALADEIHYRGLSVVWTGHQEAAELYWEQLRDAGLTMAPLEQG